MKRDKLTRVFNEAKVLSYDNFSKIVLISDCHRGSGNWGDNFLSNQHLFFGALTYYYQNGFTYIELGDGDELWENRSLKQIISVHSNAFWLMSKFYEQNRLYMLYGNHDIKKRNKKFCRCHCDCYYCGSDGTYCELFPNLQVYEGIVLKHCKTGQKIFLTHGHQGDFINDKAWCLGRFLVRYVWKPLELLGVNNLTSAAKNDKKKKKVEKRLINWVQKENQMLIAGHTHRPYFPKPGEAPYFNDGSCVHPRCITALEIENNKITLVKWTVLTKRDRSMYVGREILEGPEEISDYMANENRLLFTNDR